MLLILFIILYKCQMLFPCESVQPSKVNKIIKQIFEYWKIKRIDYEKEM